jgi:hypothetical protein
VRGNPLAAGSLHPAPHQNVELIGQSRAEEGKAPQREEGGDSYAIQK